MSQNLTEKLIASHLVSGEMVPGSETSIKIDQTLTQDALGTMAFLEFEAIGVDRVKTKLANLINFGIMPLVFKNAEDYERIQSGDELQILETHDRLRKPEMVVVNRTGQRTFAVCHSLIPRQVEIVLSGGLLNHVGRS